MSREDKIRLLGGHLSEGDMAIINGALDELTAERDKLKAALDRICEPVKEGYKDTAACREDCHKYRTRPGFYISDIVIVPLERICDYLDSQEKPTWDTMQRGIFPVPPKYYPPEKPSRHGETGTGMRPTLLLCGSIARRRKYEAT